VVFQCSAPRTSRLSFEKSRTGPISSRAFVWCPDRRQQSGADFARMSCPPGVHRVHHMMVHDARRTCATLLVDVEVYPRVIMRIRRCADVPMTLEIYSNASPMATREAQRRLGEPLQTLSSGPFLQGWPAGTLVGVTGFSPAASSSQRSAALAGGARSRSRSNVWICCGTCGVLLRYWPQERPSPTLVRASDLGEYSRGDRI